MNSVSCEQSVEIDMYPILACLLLTFSINVISAKPTFTVVLNNIVVHNVSRLSSFTNNSIIKIENSSVTTLSPNFVADLPNLHEIHFELCGVKILKKGCFNNIINIRVINLASNTIERVDENIFNWLNVRRLLLNDNEISYVDRNAFDNMPKLEELNLNFNKIFKIDLGWFYKCPYLNIIDFSNNFMTEIPTNAFRNLARNTDDISIDLSWNFIGTLNIGCFSMIRRYATLNLDGNYIRDIPTDVFVGVDHGKMLSLMDNKIKCLSGDSIVQLQLFDIVKLVNNDFTTKCGSTIVSISKEYQTPTMFYV